MKYIHRFNMKYQKFKSRSFILRIIDDFLVQLETYLSKVEEEKYLTYFFAPKKL